MRTALGPGPPAPPGPLCDIFRSAKLRLASQNMISVRAGGAGSPTGPDGEIYFACRSPHLPNDSDGRTKARKSVKSGRGADSVQQVDEERKSPQRVLMQAFAWQACRPGDRLG